MMCKKSNLMKFILNVSIFYTCSWLWVVRAQCLMTASQTQGNRNRPTRSHPQTGEIPHHLTWTVGVNPHRYRENVHLHTQEPQLTMMGSNHTLLTVSPPHVLIHVQEEFFNIYIQTFYDIVLYFIVNALILTSLH